MRELSESSGERQKCELKRTAQARRKEKGATKRGNKKRVKKRERKVKSRKKEEDGTNDAR